MLSRVADSLFWMSRYIERAENNARIADVNLQLLLDLENTRDPDTQQQWNPIISSLEENELFTSLYQNPDGQAAIDFVCLQRQNPNSVYSSLVASIDVRVIGTNVRITLGYFFEAAHHQAARFAQHIRFFDQRHALAIGFPGELEGLFANVRATLLAHDASGERYILESFFLPLLHLRIGAERRVNRFG